MVSRFDLDELSADLQRICLTEDVCGTCLGKNGLIGYAKYCVSMCRQKEISYAEDGMENIPTTDVRGGYDEYDVLHAIAHILAQCHSCKNDHYDNCVINVVRSCYEVIEFGEEQGYDGSPVAYIMKLGQKYPEKAEIIMQEYNRVKAEKAEREDV